MWGAAFLVAVAAAFALPEYTVARAAPASATGSGSGAVAYGDVALVGDSLSFQATAAETAELRAAGWKVTIDAEPGRRIAYDANPGPSSGITAVRKLRADGFDPHTWIIELGTNEMWTAAGRDPKAMRALIEKMLHEIGPGHRVVWVNIHFGTAPEGTAVFNRVLAQVAGERPDLIVANWADRAVTPGYLVHDQIHLTPAGIAAMGQVVAAGAERAAALA
jgi:GDSL-like lipase/acylhydrolase family protein